MKTLNRKVWSNQSGKWIWALLIGLNLLAIFLYLTYAFDLENWAYVLKRRIPNVAAMILTGVSIGSGTLVFQTISENRLITPSLFGLDALYLMVQTLTVFLFGAGSVLVVNNLLNFSLSLGLMLFFAMALLGMTFLKQKDLYLTLMMGLVFGILFRSLGGFLQMLIDPNEFSIVQGKMFASFNHVPVNLLLLATLLMAGVLFHWQRRHRELDVLALGRDHAVNLGIDYDREVLKLLVGVVILMGTTTALVGPLSFLGLLLANIARSLYPRHEHRGLLILVGLLGTIILVGGQFVVEKWLQLEIPLTVVINFAGGLYFLHLLFKENQA